MRRPAPSTSLVLLGAVVVALVIAGPATAADPTPSPAPLSTPVTMSVSPPSQQQIDDAKEALKRLRDQGSSTPKTLTRVAGPTSGDRGSVTARISDGAWWTIGAGLLVLLVVSETTRLSVRRAKHRKGA